MISPDLGPWIFAAVALPTLVSAVVAVIALRGAPAERRAEILRALAVLALALLARRVTDDTRTRRRSVPKE
jgi:hypothetical protein